jgi:predicted permease
MLSDLRFALRQFAKSPGFTIIAILTLALGVSACTVIFSAVNSAVLRPLPFRDAEQLVQIWDRRTDGTEIFTTGLTFQYWRDENTKLDSIAASDLVSRTLTGDRSPERVRGLTVSASYLHVLRIPPLLGRNFSPDTDLPGGASKVVILTHEMWRTRFHGDSGIIDRTIMLDQEPRTVIGVLPPDALPRQDALFLEPLPLNASRLSPKGVWAIVTARLKPGGTLAEAEAELTAIKQAHVGEFPVEQRERGASVVPMRAQLIRGVQPAVFMLMAAGSLVLLICCANVANLLLARATARTKEMAVRTALGASSGRIVRQVLTENIVLALLGGLVAIFLALFGVDLLGGGTLRLDSSVTGTAVIVNGKLMGGELPRMLQPRVDWGVLAFAFAIAVATGVMCGLFPASRACRADVNRDLKDGGRGSTAGGRTRAQSTLVVIELGLTVLLLIGAGLFLRSFANVVSVHPGFDPNEVIYFDLSTPPTTYQSVASVVQFREQVMRRLSEQPGIAAVGASTHVPFGPTGSSYRIGVTDRDRSLDIVASTTYIQGDYFRAMGIALRRGREFAADDNNPVAPRVALINEGLARTLFPDQDPIGRLVTMRDQNWEVVGVVADVLNRSLEWENQPFFYAPALDGQASVVVRTNLPSRSLHQLVTKTVRAIDADQPVTIHTLTSGIEKSVRGRQSMLVLVNTFAGVALVLACLGIYGVMAYTIAQRKREIGIRMAFGASQPDVVALVMRDGLPLIVAGLGAGLLAACAGARLVASMLFGVSPYDPLVFTTVVLALAAVAIASCWFPARSAARADPVTALRAE